MLGGYRPICLISLDMDKTSEGFEEKGSLSDSSLVPSIMSELSSSTFNRHESADSIRHPLVTHKSASNEIQAQITRKKDKPMYSYIALISKAILSSISKKMLLGDIYKYIENNFPIYSSTNKAWKNSVRHNLSLNECFVKAGRSEKGKGHYWSIHPACLIDFAKGDFHRRRARRRARNSSIVSVNYATMIPVDGICNQWFYDPASMVYTNDYQMHQVLAAEGFCQYQTTCMEQTHQMLPDHLAYPTFASQPYCSYTPKCVYGNSYQLY